MKTSHALILFVLLLSCSNEYESNIKVTSIDQLVGTWKWESTCGGIVNNCSYPSKLNYAEFDFFKDGQFIHKVNGTVELKANYMLKKTNSTSGAIILKIDTVIYTQYTSSHSEIPINIADNELLIYQGELVESYVKIE